MLRFGATSVELSVSCSRELAELNWRVEHLQAPIIHLPSLAASQFSLPKNWKLQSFLLLCLVVTESQQIEEDMDFFGGTG